MAFSSMSFSAVVVSLACATSMVSAAAIETIDGTAAKFLEFKATYNRAYASDDEEQQRFAIFQENMRVAEALTLESQGTAEFGMTKFSDLTAAEFKTQYLNYVSSGQRADETVQRSANFVKEQAPEQVSWIGNLTTPVKDQGQCGSCWAFSATEQIESMAIKAGLLTTSNPLAVQQIVSCDKGLDEGCNGGDTPTAYQYVKRAGGLELETYYPYKSGHNGRTGRCETPKKENLDIDVVTYKEIEKKDEDAMMEYIAESGPLSICVDAQKWQHYRSGYLTKQSCGGAELDHCVQLVGYDFTMKEFDSKVWWVRNSWNTNWGVRGFIALSYGEDTCGVAKEATTVTVTKA